VRNDSYYPLLLFEIGYPGLLLFLAIALGIVATGLRQLERVRTREVHGLGALMLTIVCMLLATSLGEPYLNMAPIPTYFWLAAGVAVSLLALDRRVLLGRVAALPGALELDAAGAGVAAAPPVGAGTVGGGA
jgi:hypothetical protein